MAEIVYLLHSRRKDLSEDKRRDCERIMALTPEQSECYRFVQRIYSVYDKELDSDGAQQRIMKAWAMLSDTAKNRFSKFGNALANTREELFNYFDFSLTTGWSEAKFGPRPSVRQSKRWSRPACRLMRGRS
jgi:transposase